MARPKAVNHHYFSHWNSEMAYVLGFFYADGTLTTNKYGSTYFVLQISDQELLQSIRASLRSEHKIAHRVHNKDQSIFYRLQIGSRQIIADLIHIGITKRKANRIKIPTIPPQYISDFVRGYFDDDGNVWVGEIHKRRPKPTLTISTCFTLIKLRKILEPISPKMTQTNTQNLCEKQAGVRTELTFSEEEAQFCSQILRVWVVKLAVLVRHAHACLTKTASVCGFW